MLRICSLASGSSGNATLVATDRTRLLIDSGAPAKVITDRLLRIGCHPAELDGILISHAHCDHYRSAGTLHRRHDLPVYVDRSTARALRRKGRRTSWRRVGETFPFPDAIGDIDISLVDTPHGDPILEGRTVGFRLDAGSRAAGVLTDLGHVTPEILSTMRGLDAIVLEANYDDEIVRRKLADLRFSGEWSQLRWVQSNYGHLSNRQCAEALVEILRDSRSHVLLAHRSENHKWPDRDNNRYELAQAAVESAFAEAGLHSPQMHRTYRLGLEPSRESTVIELSS